MTGPATARLAPHTADRIVQRFYWAGESCAWGAQSSTLAQLRSRGCRMGQSVDRCVGACDREPRVFDVCSTKFPAHQSPVSVPAFASVRMQAGCGQHMEDQDPRDFEPEVQPTVTYEAVPEIFLLLLTLPTLPSPTHRPAMK